MRRGVDFDGTLATYEGGINPDQWMGVTNLGKPVPAMVERVKRWLAQGDDVAIVTARAHPELEDHELGIEAIKKWCVEVFGQELEVTCMKDAMMLEMWDDRAIRVEMNTGAVSDQTEFKEAT